MKILIGFIIGTCVAVGWGQTHWDTDTSEVKIEPCMFYAIPDPCGYERAKRESEFVKITTATFGGMVVTTSKIGDGAVTTSKMIYDWNMTIPPITTEWTSERIKHNCSETEMVCYSKQLGLRSDGVVVWRDK